MTTLPLSFERLIKSPPVEGKSNSGKLFRSSVTSSFSLIENPDSNTGSTSATACDSYSWDGQAYTVSGSYTNTYPNVSGCDSVHTLNLTINYSNTGTSEVTSCDTYTWNGQVIT